MILEKIQKDYPNALCEREWQLIMPHLPADNLIGRPRQHTWRQIIDAIFYILRSGCPWRYLPHDLPPWQSVYRDFRKLGDKAFWQKLNESLSVEVRLKEGRKTTPSAGVIDSQTIKSTPTGSFHGYDAGKKTVGIKRHILVDTLGLLLGVVTHCASIVDCNGAKLVFDRASESIMTDSLELVNGDGAYDRICSYEAANEHNWRLEVLLKPAESKSFVVIKRRWVVEVDLKDQGNAQGDQILIELEAVKEKQVQEPPEQPLEFSSRKHYIYEHIKALKLEGLSQRGIAVELRISRHTVKKYLRAQQVPRYTPRPHRPSKLDLYKPYITTRWQEGVYKVIELFLEIKERGYSGSWALLAQYLAKYRLENPPKQSDKLGRGRPSGSGKAAQQAEGTSKKLKPQPMLSAREAAWIMLKMPGDLTEKQQNQLGHLRSFDQEIEAAYQFSQEFKRMVKEREGYKLEGWLQEVEGKVAQEQLMELGSFANGIRQDQAAVTFDLTLEYSQGQTEGQVNRLKTLKRSMYGRAKLALLQARVLHRDAA